MRHKVKEILVANSSLLPELSAEELDLYTTVLDREQAFAALLHSRTLKLLGSDKLKPMHVLADDSLSKLLILNPAVEELDMLLSKAGPGLRELMLFRTESRQLMLPGLTGLTELQLSDNRSLERVCAPEGLPALERLLLTNTSVSAAEDFPLPGTLKELFLDGTKLDVIPDGIRDLEQLEYLDLRNLKLKQIPEWFPDFHLVDVQGAIELNDTSVRGEQIKGVILCGEKLRIELRRLCDRSMREYKVILLGDAEAGKSLILKRLMKEKERAFEAEVNDPFEDKDHYAPEDFDHDSTLGVDIQKHEFDLGRYGLGDEKIRVHFWDFCGQDILHSTHRAFLTDRTLYVIVLNSRNNTQDAQARYWLRYLRSKKPDCPVRLVLNKIDQNRNADLDVNWLSEGFGKNLDYWRLSALKSNWRRFAEDFTKKLLHTLIATDGLAFRIPAKYKEIREWIEEQPKACINLKDFQDEYDACVESGDCSNGNDPDDAVSPEQENLLRDLNDLGVVLYLPGMAETNLYLIKRPDWITNAIYTILFKKHSDVTNGLITKTEMQSLLVSKGRRHSRRDRVCGNEEYDNNALFYVLALMKHTKLAFQLKESDPVFIPMLCKRSAPVDVRDYLESDSVMRVRYILDDLPSSEVLEILIQLFQLAKKPDIWLAGGRLKWSEGGDDSVNSCSALVLMEAHCIDIYMKHENGSKYAREQLKKLTEAIDDIVGEENVMRLIGFRSGAKTEFFDKTLLENNRDSGIDCVYSRYKSGLVRIEDVLEYQDNTNEHLRKKLLEDIVDICRQMQEDSHFYHCPENARNRYLANALVNRGYRATPNKPLSFGDGLCRPGEIDVDIKSAKNNQMSLCEALNIRNTSQKNYWFRHLNKLAVRYNQAGCRYLFLVSYVEDPGDRFNTIVDRYCSHIDTCCPHGCSLKERARAVSFENIPNLNTSRVVKSCYSTSGGDAIDVYHIFIRFWHPVKKRTIRKPQKVVIPKTHA